MDTLEIVKVKSLDEKLPMAGLETVLENLSQSMTRVMTAHAREKARLSGQVTNV